MSRRWTQRAVSVLRHDLTLAVLVLSFLAVSAGVIAAARHDPAVLAALGGAVPDPPPWIEEELAAEEVPYFVAEAPAQMSEPARPVKVTSGHLAQGQSLARAMGAQGVSHEVVHRIDRGLRPLFDFRFAQPGHRYRLVQDEAGDIIEFRYFTTETDGFQLRRVGDELVAARDAVDLRPRVTRIAGIVTSTLHEAVVALGEKGQLANDFSEIFAWDIDFSRSVRPGDEFRILYERLYLEDPSQGEVYVRPGRILAARYWGGVGDFSAVYFEPEEGRGGYYRPDGSSVERQFLLAPLRYSRISSRYSAARRHPILKVTRPHHGIDYAAASGTPLWSVADGKVIYRGWAGGFGNLVKVRHTNGYVSYYAHLSRFARGLKVGRVVRQKQVIGYVGSTGLATGPHVCFRVAKDGRYVDPARVQTPPGPPIAPAMTPLFHAARDLLLAELEGTAAPAHASVATPAFEVN